jgi:hypothetical protein
MVLWFPLSHITSAAVDGSGEFVAKELQTGGTGEYHYLEVGPDVSPELAASGAVMDEQAKNGMTIRGAARKTNVIKNASGEVIRPWTTGIMGRLYTPLLAGWTGSASNPSFVGFIKGRLVPNGSIIEKRFDRAEAQTLIDAGATIYSTDVSYGYEDDGNTAQALDTQGWLHSPNTNNATTGVVDSVSWATTAVSGTTIIGAAISCGLYEGAESATQALLANSDMRISGTTSDYITSGFTEGDLGTRTYVTVPFAGSISGLTGDGNTTKPSVTSGNLLSTWYCCYGVTAGPTFPIAGRIDTTQSGAGWVTRRYNTKDVTVAANDPAGTENNRFTTFAMCCWLEITESTTPATGSGGMLGGGIGRKRMLG